MNRAKISNISAEMKSIYEKFVRNKIPIKIEKQSFPQLSAFFGIR